MWSGIFSFRARRLERNDLPQEDLLAKYKQLLAVGGRVKALGDGRELVTL